MTENKKTILIVDDDRLILRGFTRLLERKGYMVTAVETGRDGLNQIESKNFDAALVDMRLPDMEGTELLPAIRKKSPTTVKIVFTGSPDLESLNHGKRKDIDAFLIKPVNPEIILNILEQKVKHKRD